MSRCSLRSRQRQVPDRYDPATQAARPQLLSPKRRKKKAPMITISRVKGPTYLDTCLEVVKQLSDRKGSSARAIEKAVIAKRLQVPFKRHLLRAALARGIAAGIIKKHPSHSNSYLLTSVGVKKGKKKKAKVPRVQKPKKKAPLPKRSRFAVKGKVVAKKKSRKGSKEGPTFSFGPGFSLGSTKRKMLPARSEISLSGYSYGSAPPSSAKKSGELDVCFALDCTGSMSSTIAACQKCIKDLVNQLQNSDGQDVRFALIPYRDHEQANDFCTKVYPFTRDIRQMLSNANAQSAKGGGDYPEAVTAALFEAVCLDWRESAAKLVIFMADAGPHGLGEGSGHAEGDPDGKDPLALAREAVSLGVTVYSLIVGSCTQKSRWFFAALSDITGGQAMELASAAVLGEAILAGARESVNLELGVASVREHVAALEEKKGRRLTDKERTQATTSVLKRTHSGKAGKDSDVSKSVGKQVTIPPERLEQARAARKVTELRVAWSNATTSGFGVTSFGAFAAKPAAVSSSSAKTSDSAAHTRIARMAGARDARSTEKVLVECFKEGKKVRVRVISDGYDKSKNCQFPRAMRAVGKRFLVDTVVDAGSFYRAKGRIVPHDE